MSAVGWNVADWWFATGTRILHVAQYAPWGRVSRKPTKRRISLMTVSGIIELPHRLHSIAVFTCSSSPSHTWGGINQAGNDRREEWDEMAGNGTTMHQRQPLSEIHGPGGAVEKPDRPWPDAP
jgi:hypothetical protein